MREQGWANQLLPHPTPGAQDWRLQRVGPVWPPSMGGECSNGDMRGLGLSPYQEATEGPSAGALVQVGRLCSTLPSALYTQEGALHAPQPLL